MKKALIVIDIQNEYFLGGKFPLWNPEMALDTTLELIDLAKKQNIPVVLIRHVLGVDSPFFTPESSGVMIHQKILEAVPSAPVINKQYADSFYKTELEAVLNRFGVEHIVLCGMMTQNCVTHTALSKSAEKYKVSIVADACATVSDAIHTIAVDALVPREILTSLDVLAQ
ncbi:cysteine hydrolase family protein [Bdellovibrio sp. HCB-162]|uniref:cysteine hydrolase family protein n=1 Tax=Bdellovibrio sp. HCB-162 TaxID=3394234 RepID=UPI0039BC5942